MRGVRPTRRGLAVVAGVLVAAGTSATFGPRAIDAMILPAVVALGAAVVQLALLDAPTATRTTPQPGDPGTTGTVSLSLAADTPATATVRDRLPPGLDGDTRGTVLVGGDSFAYDVTYRERGVHELGPAVVHARDVLGLARREFVTEGRDPVVVYPRVFHPSTALATRLRNLSTPAATAERGAFDHLREYTRSDSLRDVHWKSSAKRDDLVVQEFVDDDSGPTVTVSASARSGHADRMAEAAATVGYALLADGASVVLTTPTGRVTLAPGETGRLLVHLARAGDGHVTDRDADVAIRATDDGTVVRVDGEPLSFDPDRRRSVGERDGAGRAVDTDDGTAPTDRVPEVSA